MLEAEEVAAEQGVTAAVQMIRSFRRIPESPEHIVV